MKIKFLAAISLVFLLTGCALKPTPSSPQAQDNQPSPNLEPTTDWQTYTNPKFGYSIKYHTDWHKQGENEPPYPPPPSGMTFSKKWGSSLDYCDFTISASDIADNFAGEIESLNQNPQYAHSAATFAGVSATKFTHQSPTQLVETYYFQKSPNSYSVGYNIGRGDHFDLCQSVFNQMLSSFHFTP